MTTSAQNCLAEVKPKSTYRTVLFEDLEVKDIAPLNQQLAHIIPYMLTFWKNTSSHGQAAASTIGPDARCSFDVEPLRQVGEQPLKLLRGLFHITGPAAAIHRG